MSDSFLHHTVAEFQILREMYYNPALTLQYQKDIFNHEEAKAVYTAIRFLHEKSGGGQNLTEEDVLREANKINDNVVHEIICKIVSIEKPVTSMEKLIEEARESSVLLQVKDRMGFLMNQIVERKIDAITLTSELTTLQKLSTDLNSGKIKFRTISEWMDLYRADLEIRRIGNYLTFNDIFLDKYLLRKAEPGQIIIIGGATGNGKSAYALNLANSMINMEQPFIYFNLEMDMISTLDRLLSIRTEIPLTEWYSQGPMVDELLKKVKEEEDIMKNSPCLFVDNPSLSLFDVEATIRKFRALHHAKKIVIFLDLATQIQEFVQVTKSRTMATAIELACNRLNEIAKSENVCVIALVQIGRNADSIKLSKMSDLEKLRPSLNDIKNSNALAERGRVVISIYRPKYYADRYLSHLEEVEYMEDFLDVQVLKQTQGGITKPHSYLFKANCVKIMPIADIDSGGIEF